jgi:acyl transferase domain-containing protein/acyl carrier protein
MSDSTNVTQRALLAVRQLKRRVDELEGQAREPIAIVGIGCRFPGGPTPDAFWATLDAGKDMIRELPDARSLGPWPEGMPRWAGLIDDVEGFDAAFFGISPREALSLDPQQRLILELAWEVLERAGVVPATLQASRTGVFIGLCTTDYDERVRQLPEAQRSAYDLLGNAHSTAAGRVSYVLGLQGPAISVDTACSSSLVTIHLACQSLRVGDCELAIAGGVNLILAEHSTQALDSTQALAPDGRCKSFDASANGFVRGEGCGLVLLERLSDARRNGHPILAVVRGSAVNQDGRSTGMTAPNVRSQERLLRDALVNAGLTAQAIDYLECHGTGTSLGDPIEVEAISAVYGQPREDGSELVLGAVKSNIGHLEGASGVAGVVKVLLAMRHGRIPGNLHLRHVNPRIQLSGTSLRIAGAAVEWSAARGPRRAGVSSFGISGTNAHVILEEAPVEVVEPVATRAMTCVPVVISGRSEVSLRRQADALREFLVGREDVSVRDLGLSLAMTRTHFRQRAALVVRDRAELIARLENRAWTEAEAKVDGLITFVFPGQGAQWIGMAGPLLDESPVFRASMQACATALAPHVDWELFEVLASHDPSVLERVDVVQPILFAMMVSLAAVWRELGVVPDAVVGHSQGEIAAACVAGALSLEDAARLVAVRSRLIAAQAHAGAMASVSLSAGELAGWMERVGGELSLAADNGPESCVVSGSGEAIDELVAALEREGVFARRIRVDYASHCAAVGELEKPLLDALTGLQPRAACVPMVSTVDAASVTGMELDARYWYRNLREPVRFASAVDRLLEDGHRAFVEMGPHPLMAVALRGLLRERGLSGVVVGTIERGDGGLARVHRSLGELHCNGVALDWKVMFAGTDAQRCELPTYAFERERYWLAGRSARGGGAVVGAGLREVEHELLAAHTVIGDRDARLLSGRLSRSVQTWLEDHRVFGQVVVPGAGFCELALAAGRELWPDALGLRLDELVLEAPLVLGDDGVAIQIELDEPDADGCRSLCIYGRDAQGSRRHASGRLGPLESLNSVAAAPATSAPTLPLAGAVELLDRDAFWVGLAALGLEYGPRFRGLRRAWQTRAGEVIGEIELAPELESGSFVLHPTLLDAAFQLVSTFGEANGTTSLPFAIRDLHLSATGAARLLVRVRQLGPASASLEAWEPGGRLVVSIGALETRPASAEQLRRAAPAQDLYRVAWEATEIDATRRPPSSLALVGDDPMLDRLATELHRTSIVARFPSWADLLASLDPAAPASVPEWVIRSWSATDERDPITVAHDASARALAEVQAWLDEAGALRETKLVWITRRAIAASDAEDVRSLAHAPLWGLGRVVVNEASNRTLKLVDLDDHASARDIIGLLGRSDAEFVLRNREVRIPRLRPCTPTSSATKLDPERSVIVTGGCGWLGAGLARHLVREHGIRHVVLLSRRGRESEQALALERELFELGAASVELIACDIADAHVLAEVLSSLRARRAIGAVFHLAGVLDDALVGKLDPARLAAVLRPKLDGAWNLHELTRSDALAAFVMYSSGAGLLGSAGQGNYAAANAFLDALAHHRRARGLPAHSLAWGLWADDGVGMTAALGELERVRLQRRGVRALSLARGLQLLDASLVSDAPLLAPIDLDRRVLRSLAERGELPALLSSLVPAGMRKVAATHALEHPSFASLPIAERRHAVLELITEQVRTVLHHSGELEPERPLRELGLDSLMAVELRDLLAAHTGLRLPSTLAFDHPTPLAITELLLSRMQVGEAERPRVVAERPSAVEANDDEQIVIVAMACRYPGGVDGPETFWQLLEQGRDVIAEFPSDRGWDLDLYDPDPELAGKSVTRAGGFVYDAAAFDPEFFGVSPREAEVMDPQQRLLLELAWEALEHGGIVPRSLLHSSTGVYVGVMYQDYGDRLLHDLESLDGSIGIGSSPSVASGRIAYTLGLEGPAVTLDTACSSSLVALHLASQALRNRECDLALAGGATIMATPRLFVEFSRQHGVAVDGRCKSFSAQADGAGWAEGGALVLLERLSDARRNGHQILARLVGSAVNQDGRSQGMTAPSGPAQQRVIAAALASAGLSAAQVDVVEGHGTGTKLGDPIEIGALAASYGRERTRPLWLGSVKSNFGHAQAAAGVAGVIKMVLAMQHGVLPKTLHADEPSLHVEWDGSVELLREAQAWPRQQEPRRAGVSSFGISGTNAHVILEEAPVEISEPVGTRALACVPVVISGRSEAALVRQADALRAFLLGRGDLSVRDLGFSLATCRTNFRHRAALVVRDRDELLAGLESRAWTEAEAKADGRITFVFPGQGSQWLGMARSLLDESPVFRESMHACAAALAPHVEWELFEVLASDDPSVLERVDVVQPILFAMMISLAAVWRELGVVPDAVIGHSQGEIAAACVAGALSLDDGARLVAVRSRLIATHVHAGAMASVSLSATELLPRLDGELSLAADNGPESCVVSGTPEAIDELVASLEREGIFARRIRVDYASHCAAVDELETPLLDALTDLRPRAASVAMMSTVDVTPLDGLELSAHYWYRNLREPVRFADAMKRLLDDGHRAFVEMGPHPLMSVALRGLLRERGLSGVVVGTLERDDGGLARVHRSLAELHCHGITLDWEAFYANTGARRCELPTYAFERERYWLDVPTARGGAVVGAGLRDVEHALLSAHTPIGDGDARLLSGRLSRSVHTWFEDHRVFGAVVVPGAGFVELALAAGRELWPHALGLRLDELVLEAPLVLGDDGVAIQVELDEPDADGRRSLCIYGRDAHGSRRHASGRLGPLDSSDISDILDTAPTTSVPVLPLAGEAEPLDRDSFWSRLDALGLHYGPRFRGLRRAWQTKAGEVIAEIDLAPDLAADSFVLHPTLLDAAFQLVSAFGEANGVTSLPFAIRDLHLTATGATRLLVRVRELAPASGSLELWEPSGRLVASIGALETRPASPEQLRRSAHAQDLYRVAWEAAELAPDQHRDPATERWAIVGDGPIATALADQLDAVTRYPHWAALLATAAEPPTVILRDWTDAIEPGVPSIHSSCATGLTELQSWLAHPTLAATRLVWLTRSSVAATPSDAVHGLTQAGLWGLARAARAELPEHPDRDLQLLDIDIALASPQPVRDLLATREPELAQRDGTLLAPRLRPLATPSNHEHPTQFGADEMILITGGTGSLGAALARHLVRNHAARHLVLLSRRGPQAAGADVLEAELREAGAESIEIAACDVADHEELASLLARTTARRPLAAVFHTAGLLDDAIVANLSLEQLHAVLRPKLDGAWNLHELCHAHRPRIFALFSSAAGLTSAAGQANYAAANALVDALAQHRRAAGLPGLSLAWGLLAEGGMIADLDDRDLARLGRLGARPLSLDRAMQLVDASLVSHESLVVPFDLDLAVLRRRKDRGELAPIFHDLVHDLVPTGLRRAHATVTPKVAETLARQLARLTHSERAQQLLELVTAEIIEVLHLRSALNPDRPLRELGLESLQAIELRNGLARRTALVLPSTLAFDYPTARSLAERLASEFGPQTTTVSQPLATPSHDHEVDEPIAIIAMACRFPGAVESPADLWALLSERRDAVSSFPRDRGWDLDALHDPNPDAPGKSVARLGAFLTDAAQFDAAFFSISPREALAVDPQQRVLLELSWEALERGGIVPATLEHSSTGVYLGIMGSDYAARFTNDPEAFDGYLGTGSSASVASGRIAYTLGLEGPAITIDTACSSSLVSLHLACQALRSGECGLALAGGATIMATPNIFVEFSRMRGMAPDGRCKSYSDQADGAGWGEGAGVLVLERLSDAQRNGHQVLALVRGSAVNQDGRSQGMTAPNGPAQQRVIESALASAGLSAGDVDVVEGHGTGTALGDPIEVGALQGTYGRARDQNPLWLGSIKSNLGHTQAAAGVAGVIKMVLALQHRRIPATLHADVPSSQISWDGVRLVSAPVAWPDGSRPRRAAVSSFGISGTNAHVILEQAPEPAELPNVEPEQVPTRAVPVLLSARSETALASQVARLRVQLDRQPELPLGDLAWSLAHTRTHFDHRACFIVDDRPSLRAALLGFERGERPSTCVVDHATATGKLVFVFPGQGAQWVGMGRELFERSPVFRASIEACAQALAPYIDWSLLDVIGEHEGAASLERVDVVQPALFAMMVALAAWWRAQGVVPDAVIGHSQGEIAAAHVAGALTLDDAAKLVALRSRAIAKGLAAGDGAMAMVGLSADALAPWLEPHGDALVLSVDNGPASTVVSGAQAKVDELAATLAGAGVFVRRLPVDYASHCERVEVIRTELLDVLADLTPRRAHIEMISTVEGEAGELLTGLELDADYWYRNLRQPVRFAAAVDALLDSGHCVFVEPSPHPTLLVAIEALVDRRVIPGAAVGTLRRDEGSLARARLSLGELHCLGGRVDWQPSFDGPMRVRELPTYAFEHRRYWLDRAAPAIAAVPPRTDALWNAIESGELADLDVRLGLDAAQRQALATLLPALSSFRRRVAQRERTNPWRWTTRWQPLESRPASSTRVRWLLVGSSTDVDHALHRALHDTLEDAGLIVDVVVFQPNASREQIGATLLDATGPEQPDLVLSLAALDESPHPTHPQVPAGLALNLSLAQALQDLGWASALWFLTRGAVSTQSPSASVCRPIQAMTWGLIRTMLLEQPERRGGLLDLPGDPDQITSDLLARVATILDRDDVEDQLALRAEGPLVRRLVRAPATELDGPPLAARGTALITGGTGALGGHVARWLARAGVERLVLLSRRGLDSTDARALAIELVQLGPRVEIVACDVGQAEQVRTLLDRLDADGPPLSIVVHAAGVPGPMRPLAELSMSELAATLGGKVEGARILDALTRDRSLDAFVSFSSISATWGSAGQAAYSAANAFLDALTSERAGVGLPATSIAWGLWAEAGMGASAAALEHLGRRGIRPFAPADAIAALELAVLRGDVELTLVDLDTDSFASSFTAARPRPLLEALGPGSTRTVPATVTPAHPRLDELRRADATQRAELALALVLEHTAAVLCFASASELDPRASFSALGLDSVMAVDLRRRLQHATGLELPATLAFDYPSPLEVRDLVLDSIHPPEPTTSTSVDSLDELDNLDTDDFINAIGSLLQDKSA